jgi:hypothetical protein
MSREANFLENIRKGIYKKQSRARLAAATLLSRTTTVTRSLAGGAEGEATRTADRLAASATGIQIARHALVISSKSASILHSMLRRSGGLG